MTQFVRPVADVLRNLHTDQAGGTTNLYTTIDESSLDTADYVKSQDDPALTPAEFTLDLNGQATDPNVDTGFEIAYNVRSNGPHQATQHWWMRQGTTFIARWVERDVPQAAETRTHQFAAAEIALINWANDITVGWSDAMEPTVLMAREVPSLQIVSGDYIDFRTGLPATESSGAAPSSGTAYFTPLFVPYTQNFDALAVQIVTGGTGIFNLAIYEMRYDGQPGARIHKTADLDVSITGLRVATFTSEQFTAGWYWMAFLFQGSAGPVVWGINTATDWMGVTASFGTLSGPSLSSQTDLPDPGPNFTTYGGFATHPRIALRAA